MGLSIYDEKTPIVVVGALTSFSSTAWTTIYTPTAPVRLDSLMLVNTDEADRVVLLDIAGGAEYQFAGITVPAASGSATVLAVDLLTRLPATVVGLILDHGCVVKIKVTVAMEGSDTINYLLQGGTL